MQEKNINKLIPENIKQIGGIDSELRIYLEDYVYTYICQYAKSGGSKEKLGVLLGKCIMDNDKNIIIVSGFIQGKNSLPERGSESFTKDSWEYINEAKEKYFSDLEIIGWVHTQPGFGAFLMGKDEMYHNEFFPQDHQVLYILDPSEKLDTFYIRNRESDRLNPASGYFIYYDTNEKMQDYMIDNRLTRAKVSLLQDEEPIKKKGGLLSFLKREKEVKEATYGDPALEGKSRLRKRSSDEQERHNIFVLGSVCGILCAACIMICVNVMNHGTRLKNIEAELLSNEARVGGTRTVFANQGSNIDNMASVELEDNISLKGGVEANLENSSEPIGEVAIDIPEYYVVKKGDTLIYISRKFYGSDEKVEEIMTINNIKDSDKILYGEKIKLP